MIRRYGRITVHICTATVTIISVKIASKTNYEQNLYYCCLMIQLHDFNIYSLNFFLNVLRQAVPLKKYPVGHAQVVPGPVHVNPCVSSHNWPEVCTHEIELKSFLTFKIENYSTILAKWFKQTFKLANRMCLKQYPNNTSNCIDK